MSGAAVRLDDVVFAYEGMPMHFDAALAAGEIVAVMGPSGAGKSTLLNLVAGFELPAAGRILIGDLDATRLQPSRRPISMVFQENNLFAHLDVIDNVALGRSPSLRLSATDRDDVLAALERTGLAGKERRLPAELSGGERQRVALARVLVRRRPVLLLDEAFGSLGPALRREMIELVREMHLDRGMTVLMVTHDPDDARGFADRIAFLERGEIVALRQTAAFFSADAPEAFRRYVGT